MHTIFSKTLDEDNYFPATKISLEEATQTTTGPSLTDLVQRDPDVSSRTYPTSHIFPPGQFLSLLRGVGHLPPSTTRRSII